MIFNEHFPDTFSDAEICQFNQDPLFKMGNTTVLSFSVHDSQIHQISTSGLDVMTPEPLPTDHPLTSLPNCVLVRK